MRNIRVTTLVLICLLTINSKTIWAQTLNTVYPQEYSNGLRNPNKGFLNNPNQVDDYPYPTVVRARFKWNELENSESDGVEKIIARCNNLWKEYEDRNIRVIPHVYIDWNDQNGNEYWPQDIVDKLGYPTWDKRYWQSDLVKDRIVKLIYKLGEAWDNDPRVAWVNTAIVGYWGEQENPVGVDEEGYAALMGEAFEKAFQNKKLAVRNQKYWDAEGYEFGVQWGSFAHPGQKNGSWADIQRTNAEGRYLTEVVAGEVAYNWGYDKFEPVYGENPTVTLGTDQYTNYMIDVIKELHCTALSWLASYKTDGSNGTDPNVVRENASKIQKVFAYRFVIPEFSCSPRADQGDSLKIKFKVQNTGSAPFYTNWQTAFVLIDESTHKIVWQQALPGVDCRTWHPGKNYNYNTHEYDVTAPVNEISVSLAVPDSIETGQYMAGVTILEPFSGTPGIFFAVENFLKESQTQPLCRIGIGEDLSGSHTIESTIFDDPMNDDERYYTLTPQGLSYSISSDTPAEYLKITPAEDSYVPGTVVTLEAKDELGYRFVSWSGDVSGNENPITITMDGDKSISANFEEVPVYDLTLNAANGSVAVSPTGGRYDSSQVVILEAIPDNGYKFKKWADDVSGTSNPDTVVMDADKTVTAVFEALPTFTLTTHIENGTISLNPAGGTYLEGTEVKLTVTPDERYRMNGWSGDLSGSGNPATIVMDGDKTVSAEMIKYLFILDINANNGTVNVIAEREPYTHGTGVILQAIPDEGYEFAGWEGDLTGKQNPTSIVMYSDKSITAVFNLITSATHLENTSAQSRLGQNYPNPFSKRTIIPYQLKDAAHVELTVSNIFGQKVAELVGKQQDGGHYEVEWYAKDKHGKQLPDGIYFIRFVPGNGLSQVKQVIVNK
jgi:hypothetical protein